MAHVLDDRINSLPKWAQLYIGKLRADLDLVLTRTQGLFLSREDVSPDIEITVLGPDRTVHLSDCALTFRLNDDKRIYARLDHRRGRTRLHLQTSGGDLHIIPHYSNSVDVEVA